MDRLRSARARHAVLVLATLVLTLVPRVADASAVPGLSPVRLAASTEVTDADIAASNRKVSQAYQALLAMWSERFAALGARFAAPGLLAYRGAVRTGCGVMHADNAAYCTARNAIYFDESFLARLAGAASQQLHTDGDMAAIGVIAHEMGHAVVSQLGADSRIPYENEAAADGARHASATARELPRGIRARSRSVCERAAIGRDYAIRGAANRGAAISAVPPRSRG